ncbi:hypothetical protein SCP_0109410 [Sparassis crispa]|uniref:Uncharacterized protein n=1 Tax=Sparassis crispa TaxID=139825 RepID=A0A401G7D5_9APHY|nr:hypothetical protein SCP_0109410 [Sparassis crispa]GBE78059.1 hypothetical protein SCP_0109410 [Sparassis crispa]
MKYERDTQIERKPRVGMIVSVWNWLAGKEEQCESHVKREVHDEAGRKYVSKGTTISAVKVKKAEHCAVVAEGHTGGEDGERVWANVAVPVACACMTSTTPEAIAGRTDGEGAERMCPLSSGPGDPAELAQPITGRRWYAVTWGLDVGIFEGWTYVQPLVISVSGSAYECDKSYDDALHKYHIGVTEGTILKLTAGPPIGWA